MIEVRGLPRGGVVAGLTGCREICRDVVRIGGLLIIRHMASVASCRRARELVVHVAGVARQSGMCPGERIAGVLQVVKTNAEPGVETVALLAGCGEPGSAVSRPSRCLKILGVTGIAGRRESLELSHSGALVA